MHFDLLSRMPFLFCRYFVPFPRYNPNYTRLWATDIDFVKLWAVFEVASSVFKSWKLFIANLTSRKSNVNNYFERLGKNFRAVIELVRIPSGQKQIRCGTKIRRNFCATVHIWRELSNPYITFGGAGLRNASEHVGNDWYPQSRYGQVAIHE